MTKYQQKLRKLPLGHSKNANKALLLQRSIDSIELLSYSSAKSKNYIKIILGTIIAILIAAIIFRHYVCYVFFAQYIIHNCLKVILYWEYVMSLTSKSTYNKSDDYRCNEINLSQYSTKSDLPIYSILIPMHKEANRLDDILSAIANLNYPRQKLDVKIIIEESDTIMIRAIYATKIPKYVQIISVPYAIPQTKPKALNYACNFAIGKYITIYDAEDIPNPDQLLMSVAMFAQLPDEYICLQARLNFYNHDENILTKFMSIEYWSWFNIILYGLNALNFPTLLGGTSNHFKFDKLRMLGLWDAYNVTEDADLSMRIYKNGWRVKLMDAYTMEEAPNNVITWIKQRSRWIKGFCQTFCVHIAQYNTHNAKTKFVEQHPKWFIPYTIFLIIFMLFGIVSFLLLPFLIYVAITWHTESIMMLIKINLIFHCLFTWFTMFIYVIKYRTIHSNISTIISFVLMPLYFCLHSIAAYCAIFDILFFPFYWRKTKHRSMAKILKSKNKNH